MEDHVHRTAKMGNEFQLMLVGIRHQLITKLGTIEYKFSDNQKIRDFMNKYREVGLRGYEAQNLSYEYMQPKYRMDYYTKVQNCKS